MIKQILSLFAVLLLVAACSSTPKDSATTTGEIMETTEKAPVTDLQGLEGVDGIETYETADDYTGPQPGTQQDLVVNVGDRVFFDYDQHDLKPEGRATVERQAEWLKQHQQLTVTIEGHCDERGTREYNLALGERRAMAVRNYMVALGVDPERLETVSYGKERPAVLGSNPSAWAQNRRAVLVVE